MENGIEEFKTTEELSEEATSQVKAEIEGLDTAEMESALKDLEWVLDCVDGKAQGGEDEKLCNRCSASEAELSPVLEICANARKAV